MAPARSAAPLGPAACESSDRHASGAHGGDALARAVLARAVLARTDPNEQESVVLLDDG